jgi:hypothetical protein
MPTVSEFNKAVKTLRAFIGKRDEHHPNCSSRKVLKDLSCDCYAKRREDAHKALDVLEK